MSQRTAIFIASGLTAFVIIAVTAALLAYPNLNSVFAGNDDSAVQAPVVEMLPVADALVLPSSTPAETQLLQTLQARDEAFRGQIEQANAQLSEAYNQVSLVEAQNRELLQREQTYRLQLESLNQALQAWQNQSVQASAQPAVDDSPVWQGDDYDGDEHDDDHDEGEHDDDDDEGEHDDDHDEGEHDDDEEAEDDD